MFSQTSEQAPSTRPVIFACLSQRLGGATVSESRRQQIPLLSDYFSCVCSQLAPPSYSQPSLAELLRAARLDCDYPRKWYQGGAKAPVSR